MLTEKQEKFARCVVLDGMNYSDAYRAAYNAEKMSDKTINERACRLKSESKISARIKELRAEVASPKIMSATKRAEVLTQYAESGDPSIAMKAIDLLNKMTGEYVQKVEANVSYEDNLRKLIGDDEY